jgi:type 1 glutamine amidotransferase
LHHIDELYDRLRGPAENLDLLATAFSSPEQKGTGENEPILFTIQYGKGRIFHTTLGHDVEAMRCVGFIVTLQRGAEWAVTGKVKQKVPKDFPTADKESLRDFR